MKTITVFLASSDELMIDRNCLHSLIASLDEIYEPRGIRIRCRRWEDFPAYCTGKRTQDDYNKIVRSSDLCICMFHKKAGKFTIEEFNQALDEFRTNKNHPKTFVYVRTLVEGDIQTEELKEFKDDLFNHMGHYWCNYANDDTMKLHFVMQLERLMNEECAINQSEGQLKVENGIVSLQGRKIADLNSISFASSNAEYQALKDKYAQLDNFITELRAMGIEEGQDFLRSKVIERANCLEDIQKYESQMLEMAVFINGIISSGNVISERKRLAIEMFEQGNIKGVIDVLNTDDMALEAKRAEQDIARGHTLEQQGHNLVTKGMQIIRSQVEDYQLRAKALMLDNDEPDRFQMACQAYETAIELSKKDLPSEDQFISIKKYAVFLYHNNQFEKSENVSNEMIDLIQQNSEHQWDTYLQDKSIALNILGNLYRDTQRFAESETMFKSAIDIYERLAKANPDAFETYLAMTQNNLGNLYSDTQRFAESETMYMSALQIYERLAKANPDAFETYLAMTQNNLGNLYSDTQRFAESETMFKSAINIYERLAKANPDAFETDLATTQMNLGNLYSDTQRFAESETMYMSALQIYEHLAKANPDAFETDLAGTQNNLGNLYSDTQRFAESETMYMSALQIYERLAKANPDAFETYLASTQNNLGTLYSNTQRFAESETMYMSALQIRQRLAKANPDAFETDLATTQMNLGNLYYVTQRFAESETLFKSTLQIYEHLAKANPDAFETDLARTQNNLGTLYSNTQRFAESETMYMSALHIRERLAKANPEAFEPGLAMTQNNLGNLYWKTQRFAESEAMYISALKTNPNNHLACTNLAASLLFQGKIEEAEKIYRQYKAAYKELFLDSFAIYEQLGVIPEERKADVERIKAMLNED